MEGTLFVDVLKTFVDDGKKPDLLKPA